MIHMLVSGGAVLAMDQLSKKLAQSRASSTPVSWGRALRIRFVSNRRAVFQRRGTLLVMAAVWLVALLAAAILVGTNPRFHGRLTQYALGLAFGGSAGNLLDIFRGRRIIDFIDLGWWPIFNLADVAIIAGLLVAFWPQM